MVTEFSDTGAVLRRLGFTDELQLRNAVVVSVQWFTECMKADKVVDVQERHKIKPLQVCVHTRSYMHR